MAARAQPGLAAFLVIALIAGLMAVQGRREAAGQARLALVRQLLAQAALVRERQPDVGLLLNVEAVRQAGATITDEARYALVDALSRDFHVSTRLPEDSAVNWVEFSPDGSLLATADDDGTVGLWQTGSGQPVGRPGGPAPEPRPQARLQPGQPDDRRGTPIGRPAVAAADPRVRRSAAAGGPPGPGVRRAVQPRRIRAGHRLGRPDGQALGRPHRRAPWAAPGGAHRRGSTTSRSARTGAPWPRRGGTRPFGSGTSPTAVRAPFSTGTRNRSPQWHSVRTAGRWCPPATTRRCAFGIPVGGVARHVLTGHRGTVSALAVSPDGKTIASGGIDHEIRLWDAATGAPRGEPLVGHDDVVMDLAFTPDGDTVVSGSNDGSLRLWDVSTGAARGLPLTGHTSWINDIVVSPDGQQLASGSGDSTARLWRTAETTPLGRPLRRGPGHLAKWPSVDTTVWPSPVATVMWLWDAMSGTLLDKLAGHQGKVNAVAFAADGTLALRR